MLVHYVANPANSKAMKLVTVAGYGPEATTKGVVPFALSFMALLFAIASVDGGHIPAALYLGLSSLGLLLCARVMRKGGPRFRRFHQLLDSGEIIEVSAEVLTEVRVHLSREGVVGLEEKQKVLQRSFADLKALESLLRELGPVSSHNSEEIQWKRALLLEKRTKAMVSVSAGEEISPETQRQTEELADALVREHELQQFKIAMRLQIELDE